MKNSYFKVSVIGSGNVGSALAQRLAEKNLANVVLLDVVPGKPQGLALDLMQARGVERHDRSIVGTNDYADTVGSDVVVITAGIARKPGMSRDDLLRTNAQIVAEAAKRAIDQSPDAILIVVTNPLDVMTYWAWKATGLPPQRVMGMAGILDSARFETFIAMELGVSIADISATVLGGHGDLMVPLPRYSRVNGIPIPALMDAQTIDRLVERTRNGGAEIVGLMNTSAFYAPASSAALMVDSILTDRSRVLTVAAYLQGEYGLNDVFLGVPVKLGRSGITEIVKLDLTDAETSALQASATKVKDAIGVLEKL